MCVAAASRILKLSHGTHSTESVRLRDADRSRTRTLGQYKTPAHETADALYVDLRTGKAKTVNICRACAGSGSDALRRQKSIATCTG